MADTKKTDDVKLSSTALKGGKLPAPEDSIGRRIRDRRTELNLNVSQLSLLTKKVSGDDKGLSRAVIAGYENSEYKPGTRELRILCSALNTTPNWLVLGSDSLHIQPAATAAYVVDDILLDELPEMVYAKLLFILTELPKQEFEAIATLLATLAKKDKSIKAALSKEADVMGRMITTSQAIEFSYRWGQHIGAHLKKPAKKQRNNDL